jgi:hypothetical protein
VVIASGKAERYRLEYHHGIRILREIIGRIVVVYCMFLKCTPFCKI